jgi:hypothetical protein
MKKLHPKTKCLPKRRRKQTEKEKKRMDEINE